MDRRAAASVHPITPRWIAFRCYANATRLSWSTNSIRRSSFSSIGSIVAAWRRRKCARTTCLISSNTLNSIRFSLSASHPIHVSPFVVDLLDIQFISFVGITDSTDLWELEKAGSAKEISARRVKRWSFSINELLKDGIGRDYFWKFLDKEYSSENLRFYEACIQLRFHTAQKDVLNRVKEIYNEFLSPGTVVECSDERWSALLFLVGAYYSINIDQRVMNMTKNNMSQYSNRYTFDEAQVNLLAISGNRSIELFVFVGSHLQSDESRHVRSILALRSLQRIAPRWQEKGTSMPREWNTRRSTFSVFHSCLGRLHVWLCTPLHKIIRLNVRMMMMITKIVLTIFFFFFFFSVCCCYSDDYDFVFSCPKNTDLEIYSSDCTRNEFFFIFIST